MLWVSLFISLHLFTLHSFVLLQVILRMNNVSFTYPTKDKPTIMDVSLTVSQVSRVAVIGANGAGKSTAIKVLVGDLDGGDRGQCWGKCLEHSWWVVFVRSF